METAVMLTTFDNPYDPFDEFVQWFLYDIEHEYYTCARLARIAHLVRGDRSAEELSVAEDIAETEQAIDDIIDNDFLNIYKKVTRTTGNSDDNVEKNDENDGENADSAE